jgi:hypothetical protein
LTALAGWAPLRSRRQFPILRTAFAPETSTDSFNHNHSAGNRPDQTCQKIQPPTAAGGHASETSSANTCTMPRFQASISSHAVPFADHHKSTFLEWGETGSPPHPGRPATTLHLRRDSSATSRVDEDARHGRTIERAQSANPIACGVHPRFVDTSTPPTHSSSARNNSPPDGCAHPESLLRQRPRGYQNSCRGFREGQMGQMARSSGA